MTPNPLCNRTVTIYRRKEDQVSRRMVPDCFYRYMGTVADGRFQRKFLLITPGEEPVAAGDRIFDGVGPSTVNWEEFLPVNVPGLSQAAYAEPCYFLEQVHHWEAGR